MTAIEMTTEDVEITVAFRSTVILVREARQQVPTLVQRHAETDGSPIQKGVRSMDTPSQPLAVPPVKSSHRGSASHPTGGTLLAFHSAETA